MRDVERLAPVHAGWLLTQLRLVNSRLALLVTYGGTTLLSGLRAVVNPLPSLRVPRAPA